MLDTFEPNDYEEIKELGCGAFGEVLLVECKAKKTKLAMKIVRKLSKEESQREIEILKSVKHPHIVAYIASTSDRRHTYILMELCNGGDLSEYLKNCKNDNFYLPEKKIWKWMTEMGSAIHHCHQQKPMPIVHRDLKPANVFICRGDQLKIGDFGLAKRKNASPTMASTKSAGGTWMYMAPELLVENATFGPPSDMWAFGCIAHEMCALQKKFTKLLDITDPNYAIPPIPRKYSTVLQMNVKNLLIRNYQERPTSDFVRQENWPNRMSRVQELSMMHEGRSSEEEAGESWKLRASQALKTYYLSFSGLQWHDFDKTNEKDLVIVKICYSLFGPPTQNAETIENAYSAKQKKAATKLMKFIFQVHEKEQGTLFRMGFIFAMGKQGEAEFRIPIFSLFAGTDMDGNDIRRFIDTQHRVYKDWDDWKANNCLPRVEYCYPTRGFFTCSGDSSYKFDENKDPDLEFGTSPSSKFKSRVAQELDVATNLLSMVLGAVSIGGLIFGPLVPPVVLTVAGTGIALYGAGRAVIRLIDKKSHGESLRDLESATLMLSIAATPLHLGTSAMNSALRCGAQQGRTFSSSMKIAATVLNGTTLVLDASLLTCGATNFAEKVDKVEWKALDVLQLSMSVFFFGHTCMQPKTANGIIRQAQEAKLNNYSTSMTDESAKEAFKKFLADNGVDRSVEDRARIIRTVNEMKNPVKFFTGIGADKKVTILDPKDNIPLTLQVTDQQGNSTEVRPKQANKQSQLHGGAKFYKNYCSNFGVADYYNVFNNSNLIKAIHSRNGTTTNIYVTPVNGRCGVEISAARKRTTISAILDIRGPSDFPEFLCDYLISWAWDVKETVENLITRLTQSMGMDRLQIFITTDGTLTELNNCVHLDPEIQETTARFLTGLSIWLEDHSD